MTLMDAYRSARSSSSHVLRYAFWAVRVLVPCGIVLMMISNLVSKQQSSWNLTFTTGLVITLLAGLVFAGLLFHARSNGGKR